MVIFVNQMINRDFFIVKKLVKKIKDKKIMPLVKPRDKEKRDDFIERCMGDETSVQDFPKRGQRFAVCNSLYNARNKKEEYSMKM